MRVALYDEDNLLSSSELRKYAQMSVLDKADVLIAINEDREFDPGRTVLLMFEPPGIHPELDESYHKSDEYLLFGRFGPAEDRPNRLQFCENATWWPTEPGHYLRQKDRGSIGDRSVYFAGQSVRSKPAGKPNIYHLRSEIAEGLRGYGVNVHAYGLGMGKHTAEGVSTLRAVRVSKMREMRKHNAAFFLCLENSIYLGYVSEKFHDGVLSGRVPLYLGCPNIEDYVPTDMFVDLRALYDPDGEGFDVEALSKLLKEMTQERYDAIVDAGQRWLDAFPSGVFDEWKKKITRRILRRLGVDGVPE